jgi:glycosyltransferase involved in cell wall biosynthesis
MTTAVLTVAIPTYNRAGLLRRALESALAQSSDRIEILVSDNGSTDATPAVIAAYSDSRLRCVRRAETVSRARHGTLIFAEVRTELVLVLSDDDYIAPEFCAEMIALFVENPGISFAYTGCLEHYDDVAMPALVGPRVEDSLDFIAAYYAGRRQLSWCACVTRVADLRRIGPQPEDRIIGDMFFWTKIAFLGPVGCVARPLAHYTALAPGGDNESRTTPVEAWGEDVARLSGEVLGLAEAAGAGAAYLAALRADMARYLARSVANQFVWARLSGAKRADCARLVPGVFRFGVWRLESAVRIAAAVVLPRGVLRGLVLRGARGRARDR